MSSALSDRDSDPSEPKFGEGDASFRAAGGEDAIRRLANDFYDEMERDPHASTILRMHPSDLTVSRDKLARFLCGWLGGPHRYNEKYGPIKLPRAHKHLRIGAPEHDAWLACMERAIARQSFASAFKVYLLEQLQVPADRIQHVCEEANAGRGQRA